MGSLSRETRSRSPPPERRADRSKARRSIEIGHAGSGALRMELEIDGDDSSTSSADVSELQLLIEGAAVEEVDRITSVDPYFELDRCCGGWGVPRWPASGQAGPRAHVELSRGRAVAARDILEAFQAARVGTA